MGIFVGSHWDGTGVALGWHWDGTGMNWARSKKSQRDPTGIKARAGPLMVGQLGNTSEGTVKVGPQALFHLEFSN